MSDKQVSPDPAPETASFEARLRAARTKQGLDPIPADGVQAGRDALAMGLGMGWALDHWLETRPIFLAVFMLLGGASGILNVWRVVKPRP